MAEKDVMQTLFGVHPDQYQRQVYKDVDTEASNLAKMAPDERGTYMLYKGAHGLARTGAGMLGMVDPAEQRIQQTQQIMSQGGDLNTPEGLRAMAEKFRQINPSVSFGLLEKARAIENEQVKLATERAKARREDWRIGEEFEWKKQQAKDALEARMEQARMRSEDMRLSAEQRAEAAKDANATRLLIAQMMAASRADALRQQQEKPMPAQIVKLLDESQEAIDASSAVVDRAKEISSQIDSGKLNLGLISNAANKLRNAIGVSTEESKALATFQTSLEKMRNDILLLHKGVQTEGDAQRAMNTIVQNINDPKVVKEQMTELKRLNERAVSLQKARSDAIRREYKREPEQKSKVIDFGSL